MKNKTLLSTEKDIIKWEKTSYYNYKKLLFQKILTKKVLSRKQF